MASIQATSGLLTSSTGAITPGIINLPLTLANTEYTLTLPTGIVRFKLKARGTSVLKFSYTAGQSGSTYITIYPGFEWQTDNLSVTSLNIYIQSSRANEIIEVETWS